MVDGCFDPLHKGHIEYFRYALSLKVPLLCNLATDQYIRSNQGRPPLLGEEHRAKVIDSIRYVDYVYLSNHGTCWSLNKLKPAYYVKGADWRGRLPEDQVATCKRLGIEAVFADCDLDSSSRILETFLLRVRGSTAQGSTTQGTTVQGG